MKKLPLIAMFAVSCNLLASQTSNDTHQVTSTVLGPSWQARIGAGFKALGLAGAADACKKIKETLVDPDMSIGGKFLAVTALATGLGTDSWSCYRKLESESYAHPQVDQNPFTCPIGEDQTTCASEDLLLRLQGIETENPQNRESEAKKELDLQQKVGALFEEMHSGPTLGPTEEANQEEFNKLLEKYNKIYEQSRQACTTQQDETSDLLEGQALQEGSVGYEWCMHSVLKPEIFACPKNVKQLAKAIKKLKTLKIKHAQRNEKNPANRESAQALEMFMKGRLDMLRLQGDNQTTLASVAATRMPESMQNYKFPLPLNPESCARVRGG